MEAFSSLFGQLVPDTICGSVGNGFRTQAKSGTIGINITHSFRDGVELSYSYFRLRH